MSQVIKTSIIFQGEYKIQRLNIPQFIMPSFVKTYDTFRSQLTFITKLRSQLQRYLVLSIDWQLKEVD